jgi:hypothetical protein
MRGQAHTLEGVVASLVLLSAIIFALEMTAVTPLSASTSSQHIENQQEATARGIFASAAETGALKRAVLNWNTTAEQFFNTSDVGYFTSNPPPNKFGRMLNRSFNEGGIAYNVRLNYLSEGNQRQDHRLVYQGVPSDNAVETSWTVVLRDTDELTDSDEQDTGTQLSGASSYFAPDTATGNVFNVVRVEVTVWRI